MATHTINTPKCVMCNTTSVVQLTEAEYGALHAGKLIQDALPHWGNDTRELLLSGTHPTCWNAMVADFDEEEEW